MTEKHTIEYRARPVTRYVVTRYEHRSDENGDSGACCERGNFSSPYVAHEVAHALAKDERERLGWLPGDERIQFPPHPVDEPPTI